MNRTLPGESDECPTCGGLQSPGLPQGLCSYCALRGALATPGSEEMRGAEDGCSKGSQRVGDYELIAEIARGGMGVVWKARQVSLDRLVAIKMILAGKFAQGEDVARFRTEARAVATLRHPRIVAIHETGEWEGTPYFSMEYVSGQTLAERIKDRGASEGNEAARFVALLADAVQHAHDHGILHRDLKPSNILLDADGMPRITDFGLAKQCAVDGDITATGQMLGSPNYSPPEQLDGRLTEVGPSSDVYSLGGILYHMLTGRPPFAAAKLSDTLRQVLGEQPIAPRLLDPGISRELETICLKCLEKDSRRRYSSARELLEELERHLSGRPILARPAGRLVRIWSWTKRNPLGTALIAVLLAAVATTGFLLQRLELETRKIRANNSVIKQQLLAKILGMWERRDQTSELIRSEELAAILNARPPRPEGQPVDLTYRVGTTVGESPIAQALRYGPFLGRLEDRLAEGRGKAVGLDLVLLKYGSSDTNAFDPKGVDLRRMGALSYIGLRSRSVGVECLVREERPKRCVIFVRKGSGLTNLASLRGRAIAFGDQSSTLAFSAKYELARAGILGADLRRWDHIEGRKQFLETVYRVGLAQAMRTGTSDHALMVRAVTSGEFDAGVGRYEFVREQTRRDLQIIHEFESPPNVWVGSSRLGAEQLSMIRTALLGIESVPSPFIKGHGQAPRLVLADDDYFGPMRAALRNEVTRFEGDRRVSTELVIQDDE